MKIILFLTISTWNLDHRDSVLKVFLNLKE